MAATKLAQIMHFAQRLLRRLQKEDDFVASNYLAIYPVLRRMLRISPTQSEWGWMLLFVDIKAVQQCLGTRRVSVSELLDAAHRCMESQVAEK